MKKIIKYLNDIPNADSLFKGHKKKFSTGKVSPKEFVEGLRADFGDELLKSTYTSWRGLKQRAKVLHSIDAIPISPEFQKFHSFLVCVGLRPSRLYTLDRVNGALGYTQSNCKWADKKTQTANRLITAYATDRDGQCETLSRWAEITGTPLKTLSKRRSNGWSDPDIIHGRSPAASFPSVSGRYRSYGSTARLDCSPSGDRWPPKTKTEWEGALNFCGGWTSEDKWTALHYVKKRREWYGTLSSDFMEQHFDSNNDPTAEQQVKLAMYSERMNYFTEWLKVAERAMFPGNFFPPRDVW